MIPISSTASGPTTNTDFCGPWVATIQTGSLLSLSSWERVYEKGGTRFFYKYGCCKKGYGIGPFVRDRAFKETVWPQLILSFFSGDTKGANVASTNINTIATTAVSSTASGSESQSRGASSSASRRKDKTNNSKSSYNAYLIYLAYNVYLVYLAMLDLILHLFVVGTYGSYVNQKFTPRFSSYIVNSIFYKRKTAFDMALVLACSSACDNFL